MFIFKSLVLTSSLIGLISCSTSKNLESNSAHAVVKSETNKKLKTNITLHAVDDGFKIVSEVSGLAPNAVQAIHIHENGLCEGNFSSAGGHFNPHKHRHGAPNAHESHGGDLGNLKSDASGKAFSVVVVHGIPLKDVVGKAVIIHAKSDDFISQPSGNAGDRMACGIIEKTVKE